MRRKDRDSSGDDLDEEYEDIAILDGDDDDDDDASEEKSEKGSSLLYRRKLLQHRLFLLFLILILVGLVCYAGYLVYKWVTNRYFHEYEVEQDIPISLEGQYSFIRFENNLVYYNGDGAAYLDENGKVMWASSYEMNNPVAEVRGDYLAIADIKGTRIEIFDQNGSTGRADTVIPITRFTVAEQGVVAAILEADVANYVNFYTKEGKKLDIGIKTVISGEGGYPLDLALSPSGTGLMVSYVGVESTGIKEKVVFYNYDVARAEVQNLVAGFEEYGNTMVADVTFFDEKSAAAIGDDQIIFYGFRTAKDVSEVARVPIEKNYFDLFYSDSYLGLVYRDETVVDEPYTVKVYNSSGKLIFEKKFAEGYEDIYFHKDELIYYNSAYLADYYLKDGSEKFAGTIGGEFDIVTSGPSNNRLMTVGYQNMRVLKLVP